MYDIYASLTTVITPVGFKILITVDNKIIKMFPNKSSEIYDSIRHINITILFMYI